MNDKIWTRGDAMISKFHGPPTAVGRGLRGFNWGFKRVKTLMGPAVMELDR